MELTWTEMSSILTRHKELVRTVLPLAPDAPSRQKVKDRIEKASLKLFRSFILSANREDIVAKAVGKLEEQIANSSTSDKDVLRLVEEMQGVAESAEEKFLSSLTDKVVMEDEQWVIFKEELDEIYEDIDSGRLTNTTTASSTSNNTQDLLQESASATGQNQSQRLFIPIVDPISKGPLTDPVKNMHCNHFYGKNSIKLLIAGNSKARCPYPGCPNKQYIRMEHLIFDGEMAGKIAAKLGMKAQEKKKENPENQARRKSGRGGNKSFVDVELDGSS